ncbi:ABC transporter substrate-binding protein [Pseudomonas gingeri]|uniref:Extracellular solute-binding protein n=1 Tax=Pseudomonas gingeri TaxID=117681 RepID=A0A7Y7YG21_9PSED|nr:ABC transporter substrate-binding protein [Pseudomonas gingeri]NWB31438.1 extracellular solute-binding protein [Pseudomonas gingeri]NWC35697.1 extracellular solute-binding protein [Pseudomonas gingeri]
MLKTKFISCALIILGLQSNAAFASDVVLYSSNDVQTVSTLVDQFEKQNPEINVSVVRAGTGALMQRIKAEAANPLGDIFWSGGLSTIGAFQDQLEPYKSPEASAVPSQYRAAHDQWLGTNTHVTVLMVNTRQAPGVGLPAGWADLADAKWKGRIVIPDPLFSSASYVALYGLRKTLGEAIYSQIVRNAVIVGTTSAAYQGVANGEFAVAVTMEYAAYQYVAGGMKDIKLVYPAEGTFLSPEGMALIKGAKHPAEARKLYDFLASQEVQMNIFKTAYRRPLRTDIDVSKLSELPALQNIKVIPLDDHQMEEDRAAFLAQWRQLVSSN